MTHSTQLRAGRYILALDQGTTSSRAIVFDRSGKAVTAERVAGLIGGLNAQGYWPTPLVATSHPYTGATPPATPDGDYATTHVGDVTDTSPYPTDMPEMGISTGAYIQNMTTLIDWLDQSR